MFPSIHQFVKKRLKYFSKFQSIVDRCQAVPGIGFFEIFNGKLLSLEVIMVSS